MNLMIYDGYLGAGKTLGMTLMSLFFQGQVEEETKGGSTCTLFSNCGISGSHEFDHYRQFLDVAVQPSSIVALDEAHVDLDARNFNTNAVKFFTHLVFYLRKVRCTLMMATPGIENLDSRVRGICNIYVQVTKNKKFFYYDMYDMQKLKHLKRYRIRQEDAFMAADQAYDTFNMVAPVEFPQDRKEFNEFIAELKEVNRLYYESKTNGGPRRQKAARGPLGDDLLDSYAKRGSLYVPAI